MDTDDIAISQNEALGRFEISVGGQPAGALEYRLNGTTALMPHTVIRPEFGGRGLGDTLVRHALDHAREAGWQIIPACSFVAGFIAKHPEYADLVAAKP